MTIGIRGHRRASEPNGFWNEKTGKIFLSFLLFFILSIFVAVLIFFYFTFQITTVSFQKNEEDMNLRYPKMQKILETVKGSNLLFLSTDFLGKSIRIPFPELKAITFTKSYPDTLEVYAETYPIVAKWVYKKEGDERQFFGFVSENGYFLPKGPDNTFLMFDMQQRKKEIPYYAMLIPSEQLKNILDAKQLLEEITKRRMVSLSYFQNAQEIHFVDEKKVGYWLFLQNSLVDQSEKLRIMLKTENVYAKPLQYIDLRISNKVIYKPL